MTKKRELMFSIVRGLLAILIALLVATLCKRRQLLGKARLH